ncbi:glycosyltransferase family 2 protein [Pleomorphovibrio marinus]|uniref:glycosyltransferase family 2 protein n=1 Tax=Pleomorphovibrio marinus TaxID=2164132 RepID=UPI0013004338|nr:glycosyltransferase family 2 protein [Pleomorphovibrio marinus]
MDEIPVSIVIPIFNNSFELELCIQSVLNQSYHNWELILVDDGSSFDSLDFVKGLIKDEYKIKLIFRNNNRPKGANSCRNIGVENSKGKFIAFLDSDDIWKKDRLNIALKYIMNSGAFALYSSGIDNYGDQIKFRKSKQIMESDSAFDFLLLNDTYAPTPSFIIHKSVFNLVNFDENLTRHQDFDFFIKVHKKVKWFYLDSYDLIVNRVNFSTKKIDFQGCVQFYQNHSSKSINKELRVNYIYQISEMCVKMNPSTSVLNFFYKQLKKENIKISIRQLVIYYFPFLFNYLYRLKKYYK